MMITSTKKIEILYLSRGSGFGHAMNDIIIIKELQKINENISLQIASYAEGYAAFVKNGFNVIDLELSTEQQVIHDDLLKIGSLIEELRPLLIIADEVFMALPLARIFKIPSILITHWFFEAIDKNHFFIPFVRDASRIIFVDKPEFHTIPKGFDIPLTFVGPIVRQFEYSLEDKVRARKEFDLPVDDFFIMVTPGGGHRVRVQLFEMVIDVFDRMNYPGVKLILMTGPLFRDYAARFKNDDRFIIKDYDWQMERLMVASDLVIHKGTFSILWELAFLGIPSISIPDVHNPVDINHAQNMAKMDITITINANELNPDLFIDKLNHLIHSQDLREKMSNAGKKFATMRGQQEAARIINDHVKKVE